MYGKHSGHAPKFSPDRAKPHGCAKFLSQTTIQTSLDFKITPQKLRQILNSTKKIICV